MLIVYLVAQLQRAELAHQQQVGGLLGQVGHGLQLQY